MRTTKSPKPVSRSRRTSAPSEIAPGVFVGAWKDAASFQGRRFCVLDEFPSEAPESTHIPIYREEEQQVQRANLDRLAEAVRRARSDGQPCLIYCGHGSRRASLGGAWYLHRTEGITLDEAYGRVRAVRPTAVPAREWVGNPDALDGT